MARKRTLDPFVSVFVDRHGKERFRFRRNGRSLYLPHPSSKDYRDAYQRAIDGLGPKLKDPDGRTVRHLLSLFYRSIGFKKGGASWRATRRRVLEDFAGDFGDDLVCDFRPKDIDAILAAKMEKRKVGKRIVGGTAAAQRLREQLDLLFRFGVKQEWIDKNPVDSAERVDHEEVGFYRWTEDDITKYRAHWPLGSKPRLAMELVLWTGARRGNAHRAAPPKNGVINFVAVKTKKEVDVPVAPALQQAIDAMPAIGMTTLLVTAYGHPFTAAGLGQRFKAWCVKAGLPQCTLHGLRKALARRAAEIGVEQQGIKALGQWSNDRQAALYIEGANRNRLMAGALAEVAAWERSANIG